MESKPELQRVLEQRKREQMIKQRKQEEEARRKISPLEQELLKRQQKLEEVETIQSQAQYPLLGYQRSIILNPLSDEYPV